jgi:hypothetical protein
MAELLLIDWDDKQVRLVAGTATGASLRVDNVAAAPVEGEASISSVTTALRPLLASVPHGRSKTVLVLGGRDVQSRLLRVPPVPADELPDVVRHRAGTEFPVADEAAVIDFLPIEMSEGTPTTVLAARVATKTLASAREVASKLQITPESIAMRGCGVADLVRAQGQNSLTGVSLIAVRRGSELDLIGTHEGNAAVVRTVSLPGESDTEDLARAATREIRRTIAAIGSELGASDVDSVTWIVGDDEDKELANRCASELSRPFNQIDLRTLVAGEVAWPDGAAAFAGMVGTGMAIAQRSLPVDFLAPRKPPEKKAPTTTYALAGALAAVVLLGGGWMMYRSVASLEETAAADLREREAIEADIKQLTPERVQSQEVAQWLATDVNWLDEIDRIAMTLRPEPVDNHEAFKADRDVRLTSLVAKKAAGRRGTGGTIELAGGVRDDDVLQDMEKLLRGPGRQVNSKTLIYDLQEAPYVWTFQNDIVVTPNKEERQ